MRIVDDPTLGRLTYPDSMSDADIYADIDNRLMGLLTPKPKTSALGQVREFGKQLIPGAGGLLEQAAKGVAGYGADVLQQRFGVGPGAEPVVGGISALTQKYVKEPLGGYFEPAEGYEVAPKLGQAVGSVLGIAATRGLGRTAPLGTGMGAGAGEQIERAIEAGATPERRMQAAGMGALVGLTEALPVELAFARTMKLMPGSVMNQGLQIVRNAALTGGVEAAQEAAQNFLQNLIAKNVYKPDQELIEGVGEGAAYGAGAGAIFQAALDLTVGRRAVRAARKAEEAKTPQEAADKVAEEVVNPELTEEEKKQRQRAEIRQKQLDRGINLIDEDDLSTLGLKPGKKADSTYSKLLGKNLSDPDDLTTIRKTFDNYLSGSRQKINDITTIQKVLDKQIAGEPLNLFETLVVKNYNGEDIDAYLDGLITNLQARGPAAVVPPTPTPTPEAKPLTKEQQYAQTLQRMRELGLKTEAELEAEAKQTEKERKESRAQLKQLQKLGVPVEGVTRGEALAEAQPDLFGEITTQQGTRGTGAEAEFARQRAQFEENLRQLRVASGAAVAGVPDADTVVQATAARVKQDIATIPFSIPELLQVRNYIVRQGAEVPGAQDLIRDIDTRIAALGGTVPEETTQMELFPQEQAELPLGIQGELFGTPPTGALPTEEVAEEGLSKAGLRQLGIAPNSKTMQDVEGKNLTDPGVAEAIRAELERVVQARANDVKKAEANVALSPDREAANTAVQEARARYTDAQRNLELFPLLEQPRLPFDTGRGAVLEEAFPTPTQQEEERRFRRIEEQEARAEISAVPEVATSDDIQQLIDTIRPLRGPVNNNKATPEQQRTYDDNLMALFQAVKGPGRIQLRFDATTPQALDLNRAVAKAEGFLRNLSKTERNRLAARLMEERGRTASREQVTKVTSKQARREEEAFPEETRTEEGAVKTGLRKEIREQRAEDARVARAKEEERKAREITPQIQIRAAVTAVSKYGLRPQQTIADVRELAETYVDQITGELDVDGFAKAVSDIPLNRFKEMYADEVLRLTNIDIREAKRKEEAAAEAAEEAKRTEEEKKTEEAKKVEETSKKAVENRIESMAAKPLADVIEDIVDIDGGKAYPFLRAISKSDVATKLQERVDSVFGKVKGEKLTEEEIVEEAQASEAAEKKAKKEGKAVPELSKQRKKLKKEYATNNWEVFDIDPTYVILRSDDKFAIVTPARFSAKEIASDFKAKYPSIRPTEVSSGMAMNTRYVIFTAPVEGRAAEPIASKRTRGLQRLATERFDKAVLEVRNEIGKSTYKDLADGTTIDRLVEKFGLERTVRALMDEAAVRESQREKVGEFMMDDRVLGKAMEYLKGTYGVVVQFSMPSNRPTIRANENRYELVDENGDVVDSVEFMSRTLYDNFVGRPSLDKLVQDQKNEFSTKNLLEPLKKKLSKLEEAFMENRPLTRLEANLDKAIKDKDKVALETYFKRGSSDVRRSLREKASDLLLNLYKSEGKGDQTQQIANIYKNLPVGLNDLLTKALNDRRATENLPLATISSDPNKYPSSEWSKQQGYLVAAGKSRAKFIEAFNKEYPEYRSNDRRAGEVTADGVYDYAVKQDRDVRKVKVRAPSDITEDFEENIKFKNSLIEQTDKKTYNAEKMLADVSKYEGNSDIGRVARMLLNSHVLPKFELQNIPIYRNGVPNSGSYYFNFYKDGKRAAAIVMGEEHFGDPETALHEVTHALTVAQIKKVQSPEYKRTGAEWETAADNLVNLYKFVRQYRVELGGNFYGLKDELEFVSEAMVNKEFQDYLKSITVADMRKSLAPNQQTLFNKMVIGTKNMFQAFTKLLRKALGLPDSAQTVFDLVIDNMGTVIAGAPGPVITKGAMKEMGTIAQKAPTPNKYGRDPVPADVIKILDSIKNNTSLNLPVFKGKEDATLAIKSGALPFLSVSQIRDIYGSDPKLAELKDYYAATQRMAGYRNALRERYADTLNDFYKVTKAHKNLKDDLYEVINEGSRLEVDVLKPNKDYTDPAIKADHARLQAMYDKFPADMKAFYKKYRDTNDYILDQVKDSMIRRAQGYVTDPADKAEIKAMIEKKINSFKDKGPYAPLMFFGDHWVNVQMAEDKMLPFSFETKAQAKEFAKQMRDKGYETKEFESIKELKAKGAPRAGFFRQLEKVLDRSGVNPRVKDDLYQMTLLYLPEESFMRQFQNRKGAPTYERDALRNYGELADRVVHQLPKAKYLPDMDESIEAMKLKIKQEPDDVAGRVVAELEKHYEAAMNPKISPAATFLGNLGFGWYMGANPSAALVQLFQTPAVTAPYLYPVYGINNVNSELYQAARDFFGGEARPGQGFFSIKNNKSLSDIEKKAIKELYDLNVIPPTATEVGDIETMTGLKNATATERTAKKINMLIGYLFQNAERFNREITALAAFRLEYKRSNNYEKAMNAANDAVTNTQGDYSDLNAARVFKSPIRKVLLMFKKFLQLTLYMYGRNLQILMKKGFTPEEKRIARNRLTGLLGVSAMTSGVTGMPFYWIAELIMNAIGDDDDPYYDFTTSLRETMPEFVVSGIPSAITQGNIASRVGFRDMPLIGFLPGIGSGASKADDAEGALVDFAKAATGPVGGLFINFVRGIDQVNDGKMHRGIETMSPSTLKNFMKSYRFTTEGKATTLRGDPLGEVTTYDAAMQALGFAPLPIATQQEKNNAVLKIQSEAKRSKQRAYSLLNLAQDANDSEGFDDALKLVDEHNKRFPGFEITTDQILSSLEKHAKRSAEMLNGVYIEKGLRPYLNKVAD